MSTKKTPQRSTIASAITSASSQPTAAAPITPIDAMPGSAFLRESQLVKKPGNDAPIIPVSPATLWRWVRLGKFPKPMKVGPNTTAWRVADVRQWLQAQAQA